MEEKINKLYKIVIVLSIIVTILLIVNLSSLFKIKGDETKTNTSDNTSTNTQTTTTYDVSTFNTLSAKEVVDLFKDKKKTYVVYMGRSTCSACIKFIPTLKTLQNKYNYVTQYLDITTVTKDSDDYNALMKKLESKVTLTVNGETKTQNYSEYFGYTPMVFIIKDGKFKDGMVGAYSESKFESFLNNNGIIYHFFNYNYYLIEVEYHKL